MKNPMSASSIVVGLLLLFSTSILHAQSQSLKTVQGASVWDAKGKKVGNIVGFSSIPTDPVVAFNSNGMIFFFGVRRDRFISVPPSSEGSVNFESNDCTETGFTSISIPEEAILPVYYLAGSKLYIPDGPERDLTVNSVWDPNTGCTQIGPSPYNAVPLRLVIDFGPQFQPPFSVR